MLSASGDPAIVTAGYVLPFADAILAFAALRLLLVAGGWATWVAAVAAGLFAFALAVAVAAVGGVDAGCFVGSPT